MPQSHVYLVKANDSLVSHCQCAVALITFPPQMDCPWCGCGWLFTCITCRKAFTFAKGVLVGESWEDIGRRDMMSRSGAEPGSADITLRVKAMKELLAEVEPDEEYVVLDGRIISVKAAAPRFTGWHSQHALAEVPQVAALRDPSVVERILENRDYWQMRAIGRRDI